MPKEKTYHKFYVKLIKERTTGLHVNKTSPALLNCDAKIDGQINIPNIIGENFKLFFNKG
ncbi:MAG: hypothetical protein L3J06_05530 [Cyclobacteriaceae bacterium]|nr:hypothetical protein [Cyclobacteriaceae bacterium]